MAPRAHPHHPDPDDDQVDPWATDSSGYDPHHFYVSSSDGNGRTSAMRVNVPPAILAEMTAIVQSGRVAEYKTVQAIVRDALVHRMRFLSKALKDRRIGNAVTWEMHQAQIDRVNAEIDSIDRFMASLEEALKRAAKAQDWVLLEDLVRDYQVQIVKMREPYRRQALAMVGLYRSMLSQED